MKALRKRRGWENENERRREIDRKKHEKNRAMFAPGATVGGLGAF